MKVYHMLILQYLVENPDGLGIATRLPRILRRKSGVIIYKSLSVHDYVNRLLLYYRGLSQYSAFHSVQIIVCYYPAKIAIRNENAKLKKSFFGECTKLWGMKITILSKGLFSITSAYRMDQGQYGMGVWFVGLATRLARPRIRGGILPAVARFVTLQQCNITTLRFWMSQKTVG